MKQVTPKIIIYLFCTVLIFIHINNVVIGNDFHMFECEKEECARCLFIQNTQEALKNIFKVGIILIIFSNIKLINKIIINLMNINITNLIQMKVQLNE